jgi:hypothetical protein
MIDDLLRFLAPLTPAVLPVVVFIWYRTRRELREIRQELVTLRQAPVPLDPRLDDLLEAVEAMGVEVRRLVEAQRDTTRLLSERESPGPGLSPVRRPTRREDRARPNLPPSLRLPCRA